MGRCGTQAFPPHGTRQRGAIGPRFGSKKKNWSPVEIRGAGGRSAARGSLRTTNARRSHRHALQPIPAHQRRVGVGGPLRVRLGDAGTAARCDTERRRRRFASHPPPPSLASALSVEAFMDHRDDRAVRSGPPATASLNNAAHASAVAVADAPGRTAAGGERDPDPRLVNDAQGRSSIFLATQPGSGRCSTTRRKGARWEPVDVRGSAPPRFARPSRPAPNSVIFESMTPNVGHAFLHACRGM